MIYVVVLRGRFILPLISAVFCTVWQGVTGAIVRAINDDSSSMFYVFKFIYVFIIMDHYGLLLVNETMVV